MRVLYLDSVHVSFGISQLFEMPILFSKNLSGVIKSEVVVQARLNLIEICDMGGARNAFQLFIATH